MRVDNFAPQGFGDNGECTTDTNSNKCKTRSAWTPATVLGEYDGIGDEAEVENSVN